MKATIEFDDALYRRLKSEAALRGLKVKELVADGVRRVLNEASPDKTSSSKADSAAAPEWFGSLNQYAKNAAGRHDLASMRESVARGRNIRPK